MISLFERGEVKVLIRPPPKRERGTLAPVSARMLCEFILPRRGVPPACSEKKAGRQADGTQDLRRDAGIPV